MEINDAKKVFTTASNNNNKNNDDQNSDNIINKSLSSTSSSNISASSTHTPENLKLIDSLCGDIDPEYRCSECIKIMIDVWQADNCGCRYCSDCLDKIVQEGECKQCGRPVSKWKIPDNYMRRKIRNKIVQCQAQNCDWRGKLEDMFTTHFHVHKNEEHNLKCPYCSKLFESKFLLEQHVHKDNGDCPKQPVECPYKCIGCDKIESANESASEIKSSATAANEGDSMETDNSAAIITKPTSLTRETLGYHIESNLDYHLRLLLNFNQKALNEYDIKLNALTSNLANNFPASGSFGMVGSFGASSTITAPSTSATAAATAAAATTTLSSALLPSSSLVNEFDQKIQQTNSRIDMLQNNHQHMLNDVTRLLKVIENSKLENRILKDSLKDVKQMAQDLHKTLAINQVSILALEERLINLEKISYDGTLLWRINNVSERIQEAKSGRQTSFYSPPFYTSRNGYKMCVRVYLNGDGNGRNTHLSLFFVILRGEYDALLRWPFRQKVTFILIDQASSESKENVYDAFRPDPNSSSFRRPTSDMNIASGLPVFCPLSKLTASSDHEYVKDNTMFIKTIVDVSDLPLI